MKMGVGLRTNRVKNKMARNNSFIGGGRDRGTSKKLQKGEKRGLGQEVNQNWGSKGPLGIIVCK